MPSSEMLLHVALVRTNVPGELSALIIRVAMMEELRSSETSVLTRATLHNIPDDGILLYITWYYFAWKCCKCNALGSNSQPVLHRLSSALIFC
jgi:hypothetical protein